LLVISSGYRAARIGRESSSSSRVDGETALLNSSYVISHGSFVPSADTLSGVGSVLGTSAGNVFTSEGGCTAVGAPGIDGGAATVLTVLGTWVPSGRMPGLRMPSFSICWTSMEAVLKSNFNLL
jgi:hypothetical protein